MDDSYLELRATVDMELRNLLRQECLNGSDAHFDISSSLWPQFYIGEDELHIFTDELMEKFVGVVRRTKITTLKFKVYIFGNLGESARPSLTNPKPSGINRSKGMISEAFTNISFKNKFNQATSAMSLTTSKLSTISKTFTDAVALRAIPELRALLVSGLYSTRNLQQQLHSLTECLVVSVSEGFTLKL
eukprot:GHVP01024794.1.p1 GENE.GHVP01024794.1~~GHVP01024794.1.p1  ORF type:complete len:189 (+),score=23.17 GHVP01024794.1:319-885(+)